MLDFKTGFSGKATGAPKNTIFNKQSDMENGGVSFSVTEVSKLTA